MVTVIIPTYKNRGRLCVSVDSVLDQSYKDVEVIVVDDNSPETEWRKETEQLMSKYRSCGNVKYIKHSKNMNGSAARNTGLAASNGDYIAFLDDDDVFIKDKLKKQVEFLENNKEFNCVYCFIKKEGRNEQKVILQGDLTKELLLLKTNMPTSTLLFRRDAIIGIDGFDESYVRHQDYEMLLRFFAAGNKIGCVPETLLEMGLNNGENIPNAEKFEKIKEHFLNSFDDTIERVNKYTPGFKNKVYSLHYAHLSLAFLKEKNMGGFIRYFNKSIMRSPTQSLSIFFGTVVEHLRFIFNLNK